MVLSAAIATKGGKTLVARQFQDIPKLRVEGLLAAFPKLVGGSGVLFFFFVFFVFYFFFYFFFIFFFFFSLSSLSSPFLLFLKIIFFLTLLLFLLQTKTTPIWKLNLFVIFIPLLNNFM